MEDQPSMVALDEAYKSAESFPSDLARCFVDAGGRQRTSNRSGSDGIDVKTTIVYAEILDRRLPGFAFAGWGVNPFDEGCYADLHKNPR